jgi:hypothetical protein
MNNWIVTIDIIRTINWLALWIGYIILGLVGIVIIILILYYIAQFLTWITAL